MAGEDRLYNAADLARYYDADNGWREDFDFCRALVRSGASLLDLGCGTGMFCAALAGEGIRCVGVDPARAMLDIARTRLGGDQATWVEGDARTVRLAQRFDLVVMTGHAFQVFLTRADRLAVLKTVAAHLAPHGRFIFDSRNPAREEWRDWTPDTSRRTVQHPELGEVLAWNDVARDPETGVVTYATHYRRTDGGTDTAHSHLAFPPRSEIANLAVEAGLVIETWYGDWLGHPWDATSPEIIAKGHLAAAGAGQ